MDNGELDELNDICADLDDLIKIISTGVKEARSLKNYEARENKLAFLEDRIQRAKVVYESLSLEIRSFPKGSEVTKKFREKARGYKESINELIQETNAAKAEQGGVVQSTEQIMLQHAEQFTTNQLLQQGIHVQEKTIESLERQLQMIESSKQLATESLAELARQEEQLLKIAEDVTTVQENLKYAGKQLRSIARRMAGDAAFRVCCIVLLVLLIIIVIVVAVVPPRALNAAFSGSSSSSAPSSFSSSCLITCVACTLLLLTL